MNIPIRVFNKVEVVCGSSMLWGAAGGGGTLSGNCYTDQTKIIIISIYGERAHQKWIVKSIIGIRFVPQRRAPHLPTTHQQQNTILPSIHPSDPYSIYSEWWYWWSVVAQKSFATISYQKLIHLPRQWKVAEKEFEKLKLHFIHSQFGGYPEWEVYLVISFSLLLNRVGYCYPINFKRI